MKFKSLATVALFAVATLGFSQKDELKTLKKLYEKEPMDSKDLSEYSMALNALQPKTSAGEYELTYYNFYKGMQPLLILMDVYAKGDQTKMMQSMQQQLTVSNINLLASGLNGMLDYEKKTGKEVYTKDIKETIVNYKPMMLQAASAMGDTNLAETAKVLYATYQLDKSDVGNLYFAANYAVNGKDYNQALKYYQELRDLNYSGEGTVYYAISKFDDKEEAFGNKADRDKALKMTHEKPREEKVPSKRGEIYRNIALILIDQGHMDQAKKAIAEARAQNPDDVSLALTEADMYLQAKDMTNYKRVITEILAKNPNDADLQYNLGVVTTATDPIEAEGYYKKAIQIDPKYVNAYLNLAGLKLTKEASFVEQMNKLGTSAADQKKYDALKKQRDDMFKSAIPYLEDANKLDPKNEAVITTLSNVYSALDMTEKLKALKARSGK